nr:zinc knuckle CX2CX4HX4C [Tanacetum cinerariifolium]
TYTSNMCISSWGKNTYARALIEVSADEELKKSVIIAIPCGNGKGHSLAEIEIEYEWTPPRCASCKVFDHNNDKCPKNPTVVENVINPKTSKIATTTSTITTTNSFGALTMDDELDTNRTNILNDDSDDEGVDEVLILDD